MAKRNRPTTPPAISPTPATNLLLADIVVRGATRLLRSKIGENTAIAASQAHAKTGEQGGEDTAKSGRAIITSLGLYGASKLANRSAAGLALVTGGLVLKALHDRGKARENQHENTRDAKDNA